jgi:purine-binding chemotaxis protein CheW
MTTDILQLTTFLVGTNLCGINVRHVQEILHAQKITPVALVPEYVRGLMNLRGNILTVLDLRRLFGLPPLPDETTGMHVVVQLAEEAISLFVDRMHTIVEAQPDQLLPPPGTAQGVIARYIQHVCQVNDDLVMVLDLEAILRLQENE